MAYPKGAPKPPGSGRKKGTPNKRQTIDEICEERGYDPIAGIIDIATDTKLPPDIRLRAHSEAAQYKYPKRRSVEIVPDGQQPSRPAFIVQTASDASLPAKPEQPARPATTPEAPADAPAPPPGAPPRSVN